MILFATQWPLAWAGSIYLASSTKFMNSNTKGTIAPTTMSTTFTMTGQLAFTAETTAYYETAQKPDQVYRLTAYRIGCVPGTEDMVMI